MPRGRRTPQSAAALQRAVRPVCFESLEERKLLTTLQGGDTIDYLDAQGDTIRVRLVGNITAEFIFVRNAGFNRKVVRHYVPSQYPNIYSASDGADLFSIYIAQADADSQIIITKVAAPVADERLSPDNTATPFSGGENIRVNIGGLPTLVDLGEGAVYIGNRNGIAVNNNEDTTLFGGEPVTVLPYRAAFGVRPAMRNLTAGIQTAPGVSVGRILIGGTITGAVAIGGSVDTFYAGNILTGDAGGITPEGSALSPNNFYVGGDLRNLLVSGDVGTLADNEFYNTGTGFRIDGKLGNVQVGGTFRASLNVINSPNAVNPLRTPYREIEYKLSMDETQGDAFLRGELALVFDNDNPELAQYNASFTPLNTGVPESLQIVGSLRQEALDNYNLPLIAGQTIFVDLDPEVSGLYVGIYDPQGRLVATDVPELNGAGGNLQFRYTAKLPGIYRLQVTAVAPDENGALSFAGTTIQNEVGYVLNVQNVGDLAVGGIRATNIHMAENDGGLHVRNGDMGALWASNAISGGNFSHFEVLRGNLRVMDADVIGQIDPLQAYTSPQLFVPRGSVGLVRTRTGHLNLNPWASTNFEDPDPTIAVGFDYQVVDSAGPLLANLIANRAIGTIRAASIPGAPFFAANADQKGEDGRIDLIDVAGDFGTLATGGPGLFTGFGGNVKYIRIAEGGNVYADPYFGGGLVTPETYAVGQSVTFTDDSGARAVITPTVAYEPRGGNNNGGGGNGGGGSGSGGGSIVTGDPIDNQLTLTTYGIRGSGGKVLINIASTTNVNINVTGARGSFDVGRIDVGLDGTEIVYDEETGQLGFGAGTSRVPGTGGPIGGGNNNNNDDDGLYYNPEMASATRLSGRLPINVLEVNVLDGAGTLTHLENTTTGEIVTVNAAGIGYLSAQRVGLSETSTPADLVIPSNIPDLAFPMDPWSYGINVGPDGNVIRIRSKEGIGNVYVGGELGELTANSDGRDMRDRFEGINGVVLVGGASRINIGEGVMWGGSGELPSSGLFATREFRLITGNGSDIRGTIAAGDQIDRIHLVNGSINSARIHAGGDLAQSSFLVQAFSYIDTPFEEVPGEDDEDGPSTPINPANPTGPRVPTQPPIHYNIGRIEITGGGILGSYIGAADFGTIRVSDGFGIIGSTIAMSDINNPNGAILADGLGIRNTTIRLGNSIGQVAATGDGRRQNVLKYPPSVRQSEKRRIDWATGRPLTGMSDLHMAIGTSATRANVSGVTNSGIIENTRIVGSGNIQSVRAYHIRSTFPNIPIESINYMMRIAFANSIGKIETANSIDGLSVTTGTLNRISAGGNMQHMRIQASNAVREVISGRNIRGTFTMNISGPNGSLDRLYAKYGYYGQTMVSRDIGIVEVQTFGGRIESSGKAHGLAVYGDMLASGDPNTPTYFRIDKKLDKLFVGGDIKEGVTLEAGEIVRQQVVGTVFGDIRITG